MARSEVARRCNRFLSVYNMSLSRGDIAQSERAWVNAYNVLSEASRVYGDSITLVTFKDQTEYAGGCYVGGVYFGL